MIGPLQLLVIGFDEDKYAKEIMVELRKLRQEKIRRNASFAPWSRV